MKPKHLLIITCLAFAISGSANAASTVLLTDNFNSTNTNNVNAAAATRQTGTLPSAWDGYDNDGDWQTQIENNHLLLTGAGNSSELMGGESLTGNYGAAAVGLLSMSFDLRLQTSNNSTDWMSISISNSPFGANPWVADGGVAFSAIFRASGNTSIVNGGGSASAWTSNTANYSTVTIVLSDSVGTGSAFNGNGSLARIYDASNTLIATSGALPQLTNAYFSLGGYSTTGAGTIWEVDNLNITTVPEPSAALLGGLGLLALLRRRR